MITLDYFLYDNRTRSPYWGPDWAIKRETGALGERKDVRALFKRYGALTHNEQKVPQGFRTAVGGSPMVQAICYASPLRRSIHTTDRRSSSLGSGVRTARR
jgi:hypothetical protein